jgi:hypothetical protein
METTITSTEMLPSLGAIEEVFRNYENSKNNNNEIVPVAATVFPVSAERNMVIKHERKINTSCYSQLSALFRHKWKSAFDIDGTCRMHTPKGTKCTSAMSPKSSAHSCMKHLYAFHTEEALAIPDYFGPRIRRPKSEKGAPIELTSTIKSKSRAVRQAVANFEDHLQSMIEQKLLPESALESEDFWTLVHNTKYIDAKTFVPSSLKK